jgi:hypothetical protein
MHDEKSHNLQFYTFLLLLSLKKLTQTKQDMGKKRMKKMEEE